MRARFVIFGALLSVVVLYSVAFCRAGKWLVRYDAPDHAEAMVLLMGGISHRVLQAADLYNEGRADRLIIVEESMGPYRLLEERGARIISTTRQVRDAAVVMGIPADSITVLPGDARSTLSEALIVASFLEQDSRADTVVIVTDAPHTRRAAVIFKYALKDSVKRVKVYCSPSAYTTFDASGWWQGKEGIQTVVYEYLKIASFVLFERKKLE